MPTHRDVRGRPEGRETYLRLEVAVRAIAHTLEVEIVIRYLLGLIDRLHDLAVGNAAPPQLESNLRVGAIDDDPNLASLWVTE
jgi:hypothetical protein